MRTEYPAAPPEARDARPPETPPEGSGLRRLDRKAITMWRISSVFSGAMFTAAALAAELVIGPPWQTGLVAFLLGLGTLFHAVLVPPMRYRAWGYWLRDIDLYLRHGILFRTTSIIPHARIQHVDTKHGPIDRWLGLSEVVVYTAGTRGAIISIPGLAADTAESLRDRLAALSGTGDAV